MTDLRKNADADADTPAGLIRLALGTVLALDATGIVRAGASQVAQSRLQAGVVDAASRWPGGMHCHPYPEICIAIGDGAAIDLENLRFRFNAPMLAILDPQVMHCEGFLKHSNGYQLMWMSFSGSSVLAMISRYQARRGWDMPWRWAIQHTTGRQIYRLLTERDPDTRKLESLRGELLVLLAELFRRSHQLATNDAPQQAGTEKHRQLLNGVRTFIDNHLDDAMSLQYLAASAGLTPNYLNALFKRWTGEPIHLYITRRRMELAMELCRQGTLLIKQIALRTGYDDPLYFSRAFRKFHGMSPTEVNHQA